MRSKNADLFPKIEDFIDQYREKHNTSPSVQEIADHIGMAKSSASRYLAHMRERGMLDYEGHRKIDTKEAKRTRLETIKVPVLGSVSCGVPKYAEENIGRKEYGRTVHASDVLRGRYSPCDHRQGYVRNGESRDATPQR